MTNENAEIWYGGWVSFNKGKIEKNRNHKATRIYTKNKYYSPFLYIFVHLYSSGKVSTGTCILDTLSREYYLVLCS